ncbi:MAG: polysaccharide biosynthesis C-terminal domain-containing protein, partial [Chlamydiia bacterium]|nr:polysaccharide biosynthesis C-terminal domain-containing protein [Chlamydiia bacterium]
LSLIGALFFFALGSVGSDYFLSIGLMHQGEVDYFRWCNYFAPCMTLLTALSAFYIGQGKTAIIQWLALIGNGINIALDPLFIFGYKGYVPSMGIKGAAIATGIGMAVQMVILGILFLKKKNRTLFGTGNYAFRLKPFLKCLKVGASPAIFVMFELLGWGIFYKLMERVSNTHLLIASITQSVLILFLFFGLGLEKGAAAVSGNLIGAKKLSEVTRLFRSGMKLVFLFTAFLVVTLGVFPDFFIDLFFKNPEALSTALVDISATTLVEIKQTLRFALVLLIVYMTFENVRWLLSGLLTSAGDTFYLLVTGAISIWAFMLVPTYFLVVKVKGPIEIALYIWLFYAAVSMALLYFRFKQGKWKNKEVIDSPSTEISAEPS